MAPPAAAPLLTAGEVASCLAAAVGSWLLFRQLVVLVLGSGVAVAAGGVGCLAAGSSSRLLAISWLLFLAGDQLTVLQLAAGSSSGRIGSSSGGSMNSWLELALFRWDWLLFRWVDEQLAGIGSSSGGSMNSWLGLAPLPVGR